MVRENKREQQQYKKEPKLSRSFLFHADELKKENSVCTNKSENKKYRSKPFWKKQSFWANIIGAGLLGVTAYLAYYAVKQWEVMVQQTVLARIATLAAKKSADAASEAVKAAQDASHLDQRAWVTVQHLKLHRAERSTIFASLVNTGRTPATFTYKFQREPGDGKNEPKWKRWQNVRQTEGPQVIFPGDIPKSINVPLGGYFGEFFPPGYFGPGYFGETIPTNIFISFRIEYRDIFGCQHFSEICASHSLKDAPDIFRACKTGNAIDETPCEKSNP